MKHGCFIAVAIVALAASGCRNAHNHQLLHREMRLLEDQIYALEEENHHLAAQLASARRENASLRDELDGGERPSRREGGVPRGPSVELPELPSNDEADGPSFTPEGEDPGDAPPFEPEPSAEAIPAPDGAGAIEDPNVNDVTFHRLLTGGYDFDGRPGDDGLSVVLEPRNPRGELVRTPGDVEIALVDPDRGDGRVAQWRFTAEELADYWECRAVGQGFFLELPWPSRAPDRRQLELIVSYRTPRGKRLIAERQVAIDPPGGRFADWSESSASVRAERPVSVVAPAKPKRGASWSPHR